MNILRLGAALLSATAALATAVSQPAQAQYYGPGSGWQQPMESGRIIRPSQSGRTYQLNRPVMPQQPSYGPQRQLPSQRGYGHSSGSYFGW